jgi:hypothetical protein
MFYYACVKGVNHKHPLLPGQPYFDTCACIQSQIVKIENDGRGKSWQESFLQQHSKLIKHHHRVYRKKTLWKLPRLLDFSLVFLRLWIRSSVDEIEFLLIRVVVDCPQNEEPSSENALDAPTHRHQFDSSFPT